MPQLGNPPLHPQHSGAQHHITTTPAATAATTWSYRRYTTTKLPQRMLRTRDTNQSYPPTSHIFTQGIHTAAMVVRLSATRRLRWEDPRRGRPLRRGDLSANGWLEGIMIPYQMEPSWNRRVHMEQTHHPAEGRDTTMDSIPRHLRGRTRMPCSRSRSWTENIGGTRNNDWDD